MVWRGDGDDARRGSVDAAGIGKRGAFQYKECTHGIKRNLIKLVVTHSFTQPIDSRRHPVQSLLARAFGFGRFAILASLPSTSTPPGVFRSGTDLSAQAISQKRSQS